MRTECLRLQIHSTLDTKPPNAPYMDAPGGASVMSEMGNRDRTARLYPACG